MNQIRCGEWSSEKMCYTEYQKFLAVVLIFFQCFLCLNFFYKNENISCLQEKKLVLGLIQPFHTTHLVLLPSSLTHLLLKEKKDKIEGCKQFIRHQSHPESPLSFWSAPRMQSLAKSNETVHTSRTSGPLCSNFIG